MLKDLFLFLIGICFFGYILNIRKYFKIKINKELLNENYILEYKKLINNSKSFKKYKLFLEYGISITILSLFLIFSFNKNEELIFFIISFVGILLLLYFDNYLVYKFKQSYKEEIIKPFLLNYDSNLTYSVRDDSIAEDYFLAFDRRNFFEGHDYITNVFNNVNYYLASVYVYNLREFTDLNRRYNRNNVIKCTFAFASITKNFINNIALNSSEKLESYKDIFHYQIDIQKLIKKMNELEKNTNINFSLRLFDNKVIFKFDVKELFNPLLFVSNEKQFLRSLNILENEQLIIREILDILLA